MKTGLNSAGALALLLATALFAYTPGLTAQSPQESAPPGSQETAPPNQQATPPAQQQQDEQSSKTFQGKILKLQNGKFALVTGETADGKMSGHFLDDQSIAQKYEGKQVTVTGTLEMASNTIHVTKIDAA